MHANAAGCSIHKFLIDDFHKYANNKLKNINFNEDTFEVNFICNYNEDLSQMIYELNDLKPTYGQQNKEPLILIEKIPIDKKTISIMGKNKDTVKINYKNNTYLFFKAKNFISKIEEISTNNFYCSIIGTPNINEFNNIVEPQLLVREWEILEDIDNNLFEF